MVLAIQWKLQQTHLVEERLALHYYARYLCDVRSEWWEVAVRLVEGRAVAVGAEELGAWHFEWITWVDNLWRREHLMYKQTFSLYRPLPLYIQPPPPNQRSAYRSSGYPLLSAIDDTLSR